MKKILYSLLLAALFFSCEKYPDSGSENLEYFNFDIIGNMQSAEGGEYLPMDIGVQIDLESLMPKTENKFRLELQVVAGNGSIDKTIITADNQGKMVTKWELGNTKNDQTLNCRILDSEDKLYSEFNIEALAFFLDKENIISKGYLVGIKDMVRDTINQRSMLKSGRDIYVNTNKFYKWEPLNNFNYSIFSELEINSKGEIFASCNRGELYKSSDWGATWNYLSNPIPDNNYGFNLSISKDDYIWANKWGTGIYCSKDNGHTWSKDTVGFENQEQLGRVYNYADSLHMAISRSDLTIHQSSDDGLTWKPINTPEYSLSMYVTDENAIIAQNQGGFTLHKSTDGGKIYKQVFKPYVEWSTTSSNCFDKFKNDYYLLAPGGGVWRTKDFEEFEGLMRFNLQRNLFIDHMGTIFASGFNYSNAESEPTYVLPQIK